MAAVHSACAASGCPLSAVTFFPCDMKACGCTTMDATKSAIPAHARYSGARASSLSRRELSLCCSTPLESDVYPQMIVEMRPMKAKSRAR